ncbi:MmgE/PrpD family protein [Nonomuraea sp. PA05]|uniref:MmgE/PrpD family protein n=1 Tax=Nonomuraea sp. PA05 TaxID=2604466 RepID=UPI0011D95EF7|nr:MmgE/PrpD family protein [Nonomuraea sp. PA05]TYB64281.1 MmgE/PrpD family protein [Nonomuraea sp. PA05]
MTAPSSASPGSAAPTQAARLASWALGLTLDAVPEPAVAAARRHLIDGFGCAIAGAPHAAPAVEVALGLGGPPQATVIGTRHRVGAPAAALANGTLVHALDFDDTHAGGLVHATAPVLAAAFAVGEETAATGEEVLVAALAGYETICRLGAAVPHGFHARGLHATSVCGVLAAALVAARLYGLTPPQAVDALGIAGSQAGGLLEFLSTGADTKRLHPGLAAHSGILAARLARAGATGPGTVLEGEHGLYGALLGEAGLRPAAGLGEVWEVTRITIKPYPACQLLHAALDAAATVPSPQDVESVVAEVHPDAAAIVCGPGKERPRTPYEAKFSLAWSVAAMLLDGEVGVRTYERVDRPEVAALAARITHEVVAFPGVAADQPGRLRVRYADGGGAVAQVPRSSGGPGDPGIDELARRKALAGGLPVAVVERLLRLQELPGVTTLMAGLAAGREVR